MLGFTYSYLPTYLPRHVGSPEHRFCSVDSKTAEIYVCRAKLLYASAAESIDIVGSRPAMNSFIVLLLFINRTQNVLFTAQ